jgi:phage terminase large subunit GpA-like protein
MKRDPRACVHCPHCDRHLAVWAEVEAAMETMDEAAVEHGAWSVCPGCCGVIHVRANGDHVPPAEGQIEALPEPLKGEVVAQIWLARMAIEAAKRGFLVSFSRIEDWQPPPPSHDQPRPSSMGSTSRH